MARRRIPASLTLLTGLLMLGLTSCAASTEPVADPEPTAENVVEETLTPEVEGPVDSVSVQVGNVTVPQSFEDFTLVSPETVTLSFTCLDFGYPTSGGPNSQDGSLWNETFYYVKDIEALRTATSCADVVNLPMTLFVQASGYTDEAALQDFYGNGAGFTQDAATGALCGSGSFRVFCVVNAGAVSWNVSPGRTADPDSLAPSVPGWAVAISGS